MKNNLSSSTKFNLPMSILKQGENDYLITSPMKDLIIIADATSFEEALEEARTSLLFNLYDLYEDDIPFPVVTENDLLTLEKEKKENESIVLVESTLENIIKEFKNSAKVNS